MSEKEKRTVYTDELNENLLHMLDGQTPTREQVETIHRNRRSMAGSNHASQRKKRIAQQNRRFFLMSIGIAAGVVVAAGALVYVSLLFLY